MINRSIISNYYDLLIYLDDIDLYVKSFLTYYYSSEEERKEMYLPDILTNLSSINEIIINIKFFLYRKKWFNTDLFYDDSFDDINISFEEFLKWIEGDI